MLRLPSLRKQIWGTVRSGPGPLLTAELEKVLTAEQYAKWDKEVNRWLEQLQKRFQEQK